MSKLGIHSLSSTKRIAAEALSWPPSSSRLSARVTRATSSANHFAWRARASPKASVTRPPKIGSQINALSRGQLASIMASLSFSGAGHPDQHRQQDDEAKDHGEGVVVEASGLHVADDAGDAVDHRRRAVHQQAIDQAGIAALPRQAAELDAAAGEALDPQVVETVLVLEDAGEQATDRALARPLRQLRPEQVDEGGAGEAGEGQPEHRRGDEVQAEADRGLEPAVLVVPEHLGGAGDIVVLRQHGDRAAEEIAEQ